MPSFESNSPLRYPGGKAILSEFLAATIDANAIKDCTYAEPYAGGAGAAINLLLAGKVARIVLNDADKSVWSFWYSVLHHTKELIELIQNTPVSVEEWKKQRLIYQQQKKRTVELGFAAFYLNRCNRSGIMTNGGVIGGLTQSGKWKINARYNQKELIRRINRIAEMREKIKICHQDAIEFLRLEVLKADDRSKYFIYLDPPYYVKGSRLYLNYYQPKDHAKLARFLKTIKNVRWLVTYDDTEAIRDLYSWADVEKFKLQYSAAAAKQGSEIVISSDGLIVPLERLTAMSA